MGNIQYSSFEEELKNEFIVSAQEHLVETENSLIKLEKDPENKSLINDIFRRFHSIKGDSASMSYTGIADLAHEAETVFDLIREGSCYPKPALLDILLSVTSHISGQITAILNNADIQDGGLLISQLKDYIANISAQPELENSRLEQSEVEMENEVTENLITSYVVFRCQNLVCAFPVARSSEIIIKPHITPIPNVNQYIRGVMNLRGSVVPVISLSQRMRILSETENDNWVMIFHSESGALGFLVSEVLGVKNWLEKEIQRPNDISALHLDETFVSGVMKDHDQIVLILKLAVIAKRTYEHE